MPRYPVIFLRNSRTNSLILVVFELSKSFTLTFLYRYFQGSEGYRKHVFNYWHGVLASYFEGVDDMDRKAEVRKFCENF